MPQIVDVRGNPIQRDQLAEPQTSRVGMLHQEFAGHPVRGLTPQKLSTILQLAEQGDLVSQCDLFEDMEERDGHIHAEMGKRKRALLGLDWDIVPPRNATAREKADTAYVREVLQDFSGLGDLLLDLLDGIGYAYSACEIDWEMEGNEWRPQCIEHRPPRWFTVDRETRTELRLRDNSPDGQTLNPFGWVVHYHKAKSGYLARGGLHRILAWPFLFKNYSVRDLAEFLEIYGLPLRLGKYPVGASDKEKATLLKAVTSIGHAAAGIIPEGMAIEFEEAAKGQSDPYDAMIAWCERTQSKAILGGTLTSQADGKSSTNALGNVHNEVRWDLTVSDARQLGATLTRDLVYPILAMNRGLTSPRRCPRFEFDTGEAEDLALYAESVPKLVGVGMRIPANWAHEKLRIPRPEGDEPVLMPSASAVAPSPTAALKAGLAALAGANPFTAQDLMDQQLTDRAADPLRVWIERIRQWAQDAPSMEALQQKLLNAYGDLPSDELAGLMQLAFAAADLAGRADVAFENGQSGNG